MEASLTSTPPVQIPAQILLSHIANLEKEKSNLEFKLKLCEKNYNELKITADGYMETIHVLREEKQLLIEKNQYLENRLVELTNEFNELKRKNEETNKVLKLGQCIYDYKQKLKMQIGTGLNERWDIFDILNGEYDNQLNPTEISAKMNIIAHIINTHGTVKAFKRALKDLTLNRLTLAHPDISAEYLTLQTDFLQYCNSIWPRDVNYNIIFTNDIF